MPRHERPARASPEGPGVTGTGNHAAEEEPSRKKKGRLITAARVLEDLSAFTGQPIAVPILLVGGEKDGPTRWGGAHR